jgi:ferredoxin-NADP reductase
MAVIRRIRCRVERVIPHGSRVYTLELVPEKSLPVFRPGQFLHLALDEYDPAGFWPESRAFSIASSPAQRDLLRIAYSVVGKFTTRMEQEIEEGRSVWVKLPYGEFLVDYATSVALFAGGTGITAFSAFLESLAAQQGKDVYLFYGARTPDLLIYRDAVAQVARSVALFHPLFYVESNEGTTPASGEIPLRLGRLSIEDAWSSMPNPLALTCYLSGPPQMIAALSDGLRRHGMPGGQIRIDAWE